MPHHDASGRRGSTSVAAACALLVASVLVGCAARSRPRPVPARTGAAAATPRPDAKAQPAIHRDGNAIRAGRDALDEADANSVDPDAR